MNSKGDLTGLLFFIVSISAFAILLLIVGYIVPQINNQLRDKIGISPEINNSLNASTAVAKNTLPVLWLILFSGLLMGLFATSYLIPTHPIFAPIFVLLLVIAIVIAVPLSNAYEAIAENAILSGAAAQQGLIVFIMANLPLMTFIIGLISLVITFAKPGGGGVATYA